MATGFATTAGKQPLGVFADLVSHCHGSAAGRLRPLAIRPPNGREVVPEGSRGAAGNGAGGALGAVHDIASRVSESESGQAIAKV